MGLPLEIELVKDVVGLVGFLGGIGFGLYRMAKAVTAFELIGIQQAKEIAAINLKIDKLSDQTGRIDRLDERQMAQGKRLDETIVRLDAAIGRMSDMATKFLAMSNSHTAA